MNINPFTNPFKVGDTVILRPDHGWIKNWNIKKIKTFRIEKITDHTPVDGPTGTNHICYLSNGDWQFFWNLQRVEEEKMQGWCKKYNKECVSHNGCVVTNEYNFTECKYYLSYTKRTLNVPETVKPYFDGIKVGDKIWTIERGDDEVEMLRENNTTFLSKTGFNYNIINGHRVYEKYVHQSAFWTDPHIVAPPRPKRIVKKEYSGWVIIPRHDGSIAYPGIHHIYSTYDKAKEEFGEPGYTYPKGYGIAKCNFEWEEEEK